MQRLDLNTFNHNCRIKTTPCKSDYKTVIKKESLIYENNNLVCAYVKLPNTIKKKLEQILHTTKPSKNQRTWGLPQKSSVFGTLPRNAIRHDYCRFTSHSKTELQNHKTAFLISEYISNLYKKYFPNQFVEHKNWVKNNIHKDWVTSNESPFTTINYNINHAIKYHYDKANLNNTISNVCILKKGVIGGKLVIPRYDLALSMDDGFIAFFDGRNIIHGVEPIKKYMNDAYRASIVFYTLQSLRQCFNCKNENIRFKKIKTKRALERALGNKKLLSQLKKGKKE